MVFLIMQLSSTLLFPRAISCGSPELTRVRQRFNFKQRWRKVTMCSSHFSPQSNNLMGLSKHCKVQATTAVPLDLNLYAQGSQALQLPWAAQYQSIGTQYSDFFSSCLSGYLKQSSLFEVPFIAFLLSYTYYVLTFRGLIEMVTQEVFMTLKTVFTSCSSLQTEHS